MPIGTTGARCNRAYTPFMVTLRRALTLVALVLGMLALAAPTAATGDHVARMRLDGVIDQISATYVQEGLKAAADGNAAAVLLEIDSPGGDLFSKDSMVKAILASRVPVVTYVFPEGARAGSAATFVTLAGDVAAMGPSTQIGAASIVDSSGGDLPSTEAKKVTNDQVAAIRELANRENRNADWAATAVTDAASVGSSQAVAMTPPVVDILATSESDLLTQVDKGTRADGHAFAHDGQPIPKLSGLPISDISMNAGQQLLQLLSDPNLAFILFTIGFYGILAELFHPNYVSGTLGAIALVLAFIGSGSLPLNLAGLILLVIGVGLFVLDLHLPSHGLLTLGGIVCFVLGASALWTGVAPGQIEFDASVSPILIGVILALTLFYFYFVLRSLMIMRRQHSIPVPIRGLVGTNGVAQTLIAPTGIAYAAGETWSARTAGGQIPAGTPIRIVRLKGLELLVEPTTETAQGPMATSALPAEGEAKRG